jgi:hypothetical protein
MVDEVGGGRKWKWWMKGRKGNIRELPVYSLGESVTF